MDELEFQERFIRSVEINLDEKEEEIVKPAWVLKLTGTVYESLMIRIAKAVSQHVGDLPLYLYFTKTKEYVLAGKIKQSLVLHDTLLFSSKTMSPQLVYQGVDGESPIDRESLVSGEKLFSLDDRDNFF